MKLHWILIFPLLLVSFTSQAVNAGRKKTADSPSSGQILNTNVPQLFGIDSPPGNKTGSSIWNDPLVLPLNDQDPGLYTMYASRGEDGPVGYWDAEIYRLDSADGETWTVDSDGLGGNSASLSRSASPAFDCWGVETPTVAEGPSGYKMVYSHWVNQPAADPGADCTKYPPVGCDNPPCGNDTPMIISMGAASDTDGKGTWTKDGEITGITDMVGDPSYGGGNEWGWLSRGDPSLLYAPEFDPSNPWLLFFADVKCRDAYSPSTLCTIPSGNQTMVVRGISLAKSSDGVAFTQVGSSPILLQTSSHPATQGYEGYSTPNVYRDTISGFYWMHVSIYNRNQGALGQKSLAEFRSNDLINWVETNSNLLSTKPGTWYNIEVRGITILTEIISSTYVKKFWMAGSGLSPLSSGIGYFRYPE